MPCPHARFAKRLAVGGTVVIAACLLAAGGLTDPSQPSIPFITPEHTETPLPTPTQVAEPSATPGPADAPWPQAMAYYVGWAVFAYPGDSQVAMATALRRMKDSGANVAWIGHNNPGEVMENKVEPGLSFAVYLAAQDPASPDHATAQAMMDAQHRMLRAAREVGLPVVFPVGYQMQMGRAWNDAHPQALRR